MSKIYLFVSVDVIPGKMIEYIDQLTAQLEKIRSEDGCESVEYFVESGNEHQIHLWERWSSRQDWDAHMRNENSRNWQSIVSGLVSGEKITVLTRP